MQERAESIGATLTVVSRPGGGTAVMMERPNTGDVMSDEVLESMMSMTSGTGTAYGDHEPDGEPATADTSTPEPLRQETAT
jgi:hypothetical protein